tara:strand:- start:2412 stop:3299 length:888 start_codon:yes stop_codon:yes gene_type:complete
MLKKICSDETINQKYKFYCEKCDYGSNKKFLFKQHCETKKHRKPQCSKMLTKNMLSYNCSCGRIYKHIQSYNRHKKLCSTELAKITNDQDMDNEKEELRSMISTLITQNQNMLLENKDMREMVKDMIPKIGSNNTTINKFNLQVFLNEQCKDAINLTDFVATLQLELADLDATRQKGYVNGITSIFVRGLRELELHKRPIHCSDLKREVLYVKDNDTWLKDDNDKGKMKQAITTVAKRQIEIIKEWEAKNEKWNETETGRQMYIDMVRSVTGENDDTSENKIIKTIAKEVIIEKS